MESQSTKTKTLKGLLIHHSSNNLQYSSRKSQQEYNNKENLATHVRLPNSSPSPTPAPSIRLPSELFRLHNHLSLSPARRLLGSATRDPLTHSSKSPGPRSNTLYDPEPTNSPWPPARTAAPDSHSASQHRLDHQPELSPSTPALLARSISLRPTLSELARCCRRLDFPDSPSGSFRTRPTSPNFPQPPLNSEL